MDEAAYLESRFGILDHVPIGVFVLTEDLRVVFWNRCLEQWTKVNRSDIAGKNFDDCFDTLQKPLLKIRLQSVFAGGPPAIFSSQLHHYVVPVTTRAGKMRFQHTIVSAVRGPDNHFYALFAVQDVTDLTQRIQDYLVARDQAAVELEERIKVEEKLRQQKELLDTVLESLTARIAVLDNAGVIVSCNRAWTLFADSHNLDAAAVGDNYFESACSSVDDQVRENLQEGLRAVLEGRLEHYEEEYCCRGGDGEMWFMMNVTPLVSGQAGVVVSHIDITARKEAEKKIEYMALHDSLTGVPNRVLLSDRVGQAVARARRFGNHLALLYIDLDNFKMVNDCHGHLVGDIVLKTVAFRLTGCVRDSDTVARLGGDEFAVMLAEISDPRDAAVIARKIHRAMREPIEADHLRIPVEMSIGISIYPQDGTALVHLLSCADMAMYRVKAGGKNGFQFFTES